MADAKAGLSSIDRDGTQLPMATYDTSARSSCLDIKRLLEPNPSLETTQLSREVEKIFWGIKKFDAQQEIFKYLTLPPDRAVNSELKEHAMDNALPALLYRRFCGSFFAKWRFDKYGEALAEPLLEHGQPGTNCLREFLDEFPERFERTGSIEPIQDGIKLLMAENMTGMKGISAILAFSPKFVNLSLRELAEFCAALERPEHGGLRDLASAKAEWLEDCQAFYEDHFTPDWPAFEKRTATMVRALKSNPKYISVVGMPSAKILPDEEEAITKLNTKAFQQTMVHFKKHKEREIASAKTKSGRQESRDQSVPQENMPESSARVWRSDPSFRRPPTSEDSVHQTKSNRKVETVEPEILADRAGVVVAAVFSTGDGFSAGATKAAEEVWEALHVQVKHESRGPFDCQFQAKYTGLYMTIDLLPSCKDVLEKLLGEYNLNYYRKIFQREDGRTPELFDSRFDSPERHDNPAVVIYEWSGHADMVSLEKEWLTVLIPLYMEDEIRIDAKISEYRGKPGSEAVTLDLVPGSITVVSPDADLYLSGPGQMVVFQVG